jgi:hypothetical protein
MAHSTEHKNVSPTVNELAGSKLDALAAKAPIAIAIGGLLTVAGIFLSGKTFFQSYLYAFMFWFGITLGSTAWLMAHNVTGGGWGYLLRRQLEAATRNWPIILAMWFPLVVAVILSSRDGHAGIYEWADWKVLSTDHVLNKKVGYLGLVPFFIRQVIYFAIWFGMAYLLNKWSKQEDQTNDPYVRHKSSMWSGLGLLVYLITVTFATIDWVMTLEPHWFSSLWGPIFLVGQALSTLCVMIILTRYIAGHTDLLKKVESRYFRDVGNFMMAFTLLWAYTNFSQFMIQYSGNIAEEAEWFVHRTTYGWQYFGAFNIIAHFAAPFLLLLMSMNKVNINNLVKLAAFLIIARHIDLFFYVVPTFRTTPGAGLPNGEYAWAILADLGLPLLLGGIWILGWAKQMKKANAPLVPVYDSRLNPYWPLADGTNGHTVENTKGVKSHG